MRSSANRYPPASPSVSLCRWAVHKAASKFRRVACCGSRQTEERPHAQNDLIGVPARCTGCSGHPGPGAEPTAGRRFRSGHAADPQGAAASDAQGLARPGRRRRGAAAAGPPSRVARWPRQRSRRQAGARRAAEGQRSEPNPLHRAGRGAGTTAGGLLNGLLPLLRGQAGRWQARGPARTRWRPPN